MTDRFHTPVRLRPLPDSLRGKGIRAFARQARPWMDAPPPIAILDLTDVGVVDTMGVGAILHLLQRTPRTRWILEGLGPQARLVFDVAGLHRVFARPSAAPPAPV